jgi:hypothetical protein
LSGAVVEIFIVTQPDERVPEAEYGGAHWFHVMRVVVTAVGSNTRMAAAFKLLSACLPKWVHRLPLKSC